MPTQTRLKALLGLCWTGPALAIYYIALWLLSIANAAIKIAAGIVLAFFLIAFIQDASAQIPSDANQHKRHLRQQAHLIWGIDAPVATFAGQIHQESRWRPNAVSRVGAEGLAQFMPATAVWISGIYPDLADNAPTNPTWAIRALLRYDKYLHDRVAGSTPCERMGFSLAGYNGGLGWVIKRKARSDKPLQCFSATCDINPGITPANQRENADYPRRILFQHEPLYVKAGWGRGSCT